MPERNIGASTRGVDATELRARRDEFVALLADAIESGASVGFVLPFSVGDLEPFWDDVAAGLDVGGRELLVHEDDGRIVGTVQLVPCDKPNGRHRAEVQKLIVMRRARGAGIGGRLMREVERRAAARGHRLLLLDTREGSAADRLYRRLGWQAFGAVPDYALDPDGTPAACVFFYKQCGAVPV
jgi:acetyltransferase